MAEERLEDREESGGIPWRRGSARKKPKTQWIALDRVACRYLTLVIGRPESGKSLFLAAVAAQVMGGPKLFEGAKREPRQVMLLSQDDDYELDIIPRIKAAGGNDKKLIYPDVNEMAMRARLLCFPDGEAHTIQGIQVEGVGLLIVEMAADFLCTGKSENDYVDVSDFFLSLARIARTADIPVIVTHHEKKDHRGPAIEAALGSQAWGARSRIGLRAFQDEQDKDRYYLSTFKRGPGGQAGTLEFRTERERGVPHIVGLRECTENVEALARKAENSGKRAAIDTAKEFLAHYLKDGPKHVADVEKEGRNRARVDLPVLRDAAHEMGVLYHKHTEGTTTMWKWHKTGCDCSKCVKKRGDSEGATPSPKKFKS